METNSCKEIIDAKSTGLTNRLTETAEQHRPYGFIIPAGVLIGLGVGMLVDHVGSGLLIGLGLGFLVSELVPVFRKPLESVDVQPGSTNVTVLLIGVFLIFIGISLVLAPAVLWPYAIAGFLILMGTWFLVRGFFRIT